MIGRQGTTFSLRARLTLLLALAVLVALGGAARIVDLRADSDMHQRFDVSVLARAQSLAAAIEAERDRARAEAGAAAGVFPGTTGRSWYELRCGSRVLAATTEVPPAMPVADVPTFADAHLAGHALRVVALRLPPGNFEVAGFAAPPAACTLRYGVDRGPLQRLLRSLDFILLGSLLGACALVLLVTPWLVQRGLRPLAVLGRAMADIGPDHPGGRLPASATRELEPLVTRFNGVLARMDEGLARERQFASGVAHEFRTRLAELRALVEVERRFPGGRGLASVLEEVGSIGAELEATVTALLQLTRIESGLSQERPERVMLATLLARAFSRHQDAASSRGVEIRSNFAFGTDLAIEADAALLEIVVDNLLGNAVAYAPTGSIVTLRASRQSIEIRNAAPALQPDDLRNFCQRFWRKGAQDAGHAGLGLALAGAAARALRMTLAFALEKGVLHATLTMDRRAHGATGD